MLLGAYLASHRLSTQVTKCHLGLSQTREPAPPELARKRSPPPLLEARCVDRTDVLRHSWNQEPARLEEVEQRVSVAENRASDQPAAREAEHVPVP